MKSLQQKPRTFLWEERQDKTTTDKTRQNSMREITERRETATEEEEQASKHSGSPQDWLR
jgi:hypothetical protein